MATEPLVVRDNPDHHRFEIDLEDGSFAVANYTLSGGKILFTHTEVPKGHEGKGIASTLIRFALDAVRERHLRVVPLCPFVSAYMLRHAEVQDLLDPAWREKLGLA